MRPGALLTIILVTVVIFFIHNSSASKAQSTGIITSSALPSFSPAYSPTSSPSSTATPKLIKTALSKPTQKPAITLNPVQDFLMQALNDYRKNQSLADVKPDSNTCNFAKVRAQEISTNFNHQGFVDRIKNKTLPYPSYHLITENISENPNFKEVVSSWSTSSGHAANMRADTPDVCIAQSGNFFAFEGWKP